MALCLDFLFQHWLVKEQIAGKSLQTILKVIKYTIRNRKLRYSFTNEGEPLSSFDVAKHRYGGTFTDQQVENVHTFLWMMVVMATCAIVSGVLVPVGYAQEKVMTHLINWEEATGFTGCYEKLSIHYCTFISVIVVVLVYEFVIHPLFSRCLPRVSIMNMFLLGTIMTFMWIMSLLTIETIACQDQLYSGKCVFTDESSRVNMNYRWLLIPESMCGLSSFCIILSALEFMWSQAPSTMKGMILGFGYTFLGLSALLHTAIASPFIFRKPVTVSWENIKLTCGIWYFLMEGMITLVVLIVITVLLQRYKKRNKRNSYFDPYATCITAASYNQDS